MHRRDLVNEQEDEVEDEGQPEADQRHPSPSVPDKTKY